MSNRERPYTQNSSPLFENVFFGNFSSQPGRHAQIKDEQPAGVADLPVHTDGFSALREKYSDIAELFPQDEEPAERRVLDSPASIWLGGDEIAPVIPLRGVQAYLDRSPDDAS